ncbi:MAG: CHAT domain-containing protein [Rhodothermales bacterium]|nr:CHAT domain-containing protein [Rhodothermales bacterium]MBO6780236.1 CHAT domain-containing protein [Rhodothermales bacterium]
MRSPCIVVLVSLFGCQEIDRPTESADIRDLATRAEAAIVANDLESGEALVDSALSAGSLLPDVVAELNLSLAELAIRKGAYSTAVHQLELMQTQPFWESTSDSVLIRHLTLLGRSNLRLGKFPEARSRLDLARDLAESAYGIDHPDVGHLLHYRALADHESGDLLGAQTGYEAALEVRTRVHGRYSREVAATINNIANVQWRLGHYSEALALHQAAYGIKRQILEPSDSDLAVSLGNLGNLHAIVGDTLRAEFSYRQALEIYSRGTTNRLFVAKTQDNLGDLLVRLGRFDEARGLLDESRQTFAEVVGTNHPSFGIAQIHQGTVALHEGNSTEGLSLIKSGIDKLAAADRPDVGLELIQLSNAIYSTGRIAEADSVLAVARDWLNRAFSSRNPLLIQASNEIASRHLDRGQPDKALPHIGAALASNLGPDWHPATAPSAVSLPQLLRSASLWIRHRELALSSLSESPEWSFDRVAQLLWHIRQDNARAAELYRNTLALALSRSLAAYYESPDFALFDRAYRFSELLLADDRQSLYSAARYSPLVAEQSMLSRERALVRHLENAEKEHLIWQLRNPGRGPHAMSPAAEVFQYRDSLKALRAALRAPAATMLGAASFNEGIDSAARTHRRLEGEDLVVYQVVDSQLHALVFPFSGDRHIVPLGNWSSIADEADSFGPTLELGDLLAGQRMASQLYDRLVRPLLPSLGAPRLTIAGYARLLNVPFEALRDSASAASEFLIASKTIRYKYSVSERPNRAAEFRSEHSLFAAAPSFSEGVLVSPHLLGYPPDNDPIHFGPLPAALEEIVAIDRLFDANRMLFDASSTILSDRAASEQAIKSARLFDYQYLHLATHGYANPQQPSLSGLLFNEGNGEDGVLHIGEVLGLELNAELVVLSACRTGVNSTDAGDGLVGLGRAFMFAGAKSVVASLWNASDAYTAAAMGHFYENMLSGQPKADALRNAKLKLMEDPNVAARPGLWAAFILVGEG